MKSSSLFFLPSFGFIFFLVILLGVFGDPNRLTEDPAAARHLRVGQIILETRQIPHANPLGFVQPPLPWIDFEWSFEICIAWLEKMGGLAWPYFFCYAIFAATNLCVYRTLLNAKLSFLVVMTFSVLAYLTLHLQFAMRPLLFTFLFMAFVVEVWRSHPLRPTPRDWICLPIIFITWANIHAGWLAALLFLGSSLFGRWMDRVTGRVKAKDFPLLPWSLLTLLCGLMTFINPISWHMQAHALAMTTSYKSFGLWQEYAMPDFAQPSMTALVIFFLLLIFFLTRLLKQSPAWNWETLLPLLIFFYFGFKAQRHVLLLIIVAAVPIARDLEALLSKRPASPLRKRLDAFQAMQRRAGADGWLALTSVILLGLIFVHVVNPKKLEVSSLEPKLITFLHEHPDRFKRPLTTTWNGGPLAWRMRSDDFRVSFDDRGDLYGDDFVFRMTDLETVKPGWKKTLEEGHYDSALLEPGLPLAQVITLLPGWVEVYRTKTVVVFWKN